MKINHTPFRERNRRRDNELVVAFKITITIDRYFLWKLGSNCATMEGRKKEEEEEGKKEKFIFREAYFSKESTTFCN